MGVELRAKEQGVRIRKPGHWMWTHGSKHGSKPPRGLQFFYIETLPFTDFKYLG